jgi:activator of 2-hydroxyglutaryl-CoA dehydratase
MDKIALGIDIGSTTAKVALIDHKGQVLFKAYTRHNTEVLPTLKDILIEAKKSLSHKSFTLSITGSAGMGLSERFGFLFTQEVEWQLCRWNRSIY